MPCPETVTCTLLEAEANTPGHQSVPASIAHNRHTATHWFQETLAQVALICGILDCT